MDKVYASTEKYLTNLCTQVFGPGLSGADNFLVALPGQGHMSLIKSLIELREIPYNPSPILRKFFRKQIDNTFFIILNPKNYTEDNIDLLYEDILIQITNNYPFQKTINRDLFLQENLKLSRIKVPELISKLTQSNLLFFISQPIGDTKSINYEYTKILQSLKTINNNNIKLIYSFLRDDILIDYSTSISVITYIEPLPKEEILYQIKMICKEFNRPILNNKVIDRIYTLSGGIAGIMKALAISYLNTPQLTNIQNLNVVKNYIVMIRKLLKPDELTIIRKHINKEKVEINNISYIQKVGLLDLSNELLTLILNEGDIDENEIYLTPTLFKIYKHLEQNKEKIIPKVELAKVIWGDEYDKKYSDWAMDKFMSDLRKQLINDQKIITKKGRGYIFKSSLS